MKRFWNLFERLSSILGVMAAARCMWLSTFMTFGTLRRGSQKPSGFRVEGLGLRVYLVYLIKKPWPCNPNLVEFIYLEPEYSGPGFLKQVPRMP